MAKKNGIAPDTGGPPTVEALPSPVPVPVPVPLPVPIGSIDPAALALLSPADRAEVEAFLAESPASDFKGVQPEFPVARFLHSGACMIQLDEQETVRELEAVIVHHYPVNAWWETRFAESGGGTRPDCASRDGLSPDVDSAAPQGKNCAGCTLNQFGSEVRQDGSESRGKACKNMMRLFLCRGGEALPWRMVIPPTGLGAFRRYLSGLLRQRKGRLAAVVTKIGVLPAKNQEGIAYTEPTFSFIRALGPQELLQSVRMRREIEAYERPAIHAEEYAGEQK